MASSIEIRADVARGNSAVEKAQSYIRFALENLADAQSAYARIQTNNPNLQAAISAVNQTTRSLDEGLTQSFGITPNSDAYASRV